MSAQTVGRYEVIGELGRGAMGVVYKAQDPNIGRVVALKTMRLDTHGLDTEDMLRRFRNEARAAGLLNHPNIVTIYDAGEQDGIFYIAMEFIEGTTLHSILTEQRVLPPEEVIKIARQIGKGLDYAHASGIIHRDIKPANIMITATGIAKIMDFGIAKAGGGMTNTGQVLGTPNYMSPEQVKGKPLDGRSDLFSLGVILYEMLTGEKPFIGQNVTTVIYKIVHENPIAPRDLDVTIHPGLSTVVAKALAKDPAYRYQSGAALLQDLENYKSIGSNLGETSVLAAVSGVPGDRTQALDKTATNGTARSASGPAFRAALNDLTRPHKRGLLEIAVLVGLIVITGAMAYVYFQVREARKVRDEYMVLDRKIKEQLMQQAAAAKVLTQAERVPDSTPADSPTDNQAEPGKTPPNKGGKSSKLALPRPGDPAPESTALAVNTKPGGATIWLDGKDLGVATPAQFAVTKGEHAMTLRKPGFKDENVTATAQAGQTQTLNVTLQALPPLQMEENRPATWRKVFGINDPIPAGRGLVRIRTYPEGATIQVGSQTAQSKTPVKWPALPGTYQIALKLDGYKTVIHTLHVQRDKAYDVDEILEKQR
ncbi:MAG TPA: serine/threonine-protein kinase [Candidatus Saccharimonadales bacterium]|jgi:serine/threonine protein kinase|nr:serine/threonine-protein kinase [Candidatus Saccharimonadales bacterium]